MAESNDHINYVRKIVKYVSLLISADINSVVLVDLPECSNRPDRTIGNFIPDLFYKDTRCMIIGEAKTENDIDCKHSKEQYESYIREASIFKGESHIVICTSLYSFARLKNIIKKMKLEQKSSASLHLLNDIGGKCII